jgi:hypothetical protein
MSRYLDHYIIKTLARNGFLRGPLKQILEAKAVETVTSSNWWAAVVLNMGADSSAWRMWYKWEQWTPEEKERYVNPEDREFWQEVHDDLEKRYGKGKL